ncbi:MAG: PhoH family protein [Caulobacteraceae bacterium]|nr:PhoH family protein [Caulobacteraceae bacterium]
MKKTYILDTNVLLSDPNCLRNFQDNDLVIPILVLEELDRHKGRSDEVGRNCREISRTLDLLGETGSLKDGVNLPSGGFLRIMSSSSGYDELLPPELTKGSSVDNMIIGFVLKLQKTVPNAILVSKDINVRVKCSSLGIEAQDYLSIRVSDSMDSLYTGVKVILTSEDLINDFYMGGAYKVSDVTEDTIYPNQILVLKSVDAEGNTINSVLTRALSDMSLKQLTRYDGIFGVRPRNKEQSFSIELLMDPSVKLLTLTGRAGCGKTLIALAAGLDQLQSIGQNSVYQKLIVSRPVQPVGRDIGFLPGTLEEKMEPWIAPIRDNLEFLLGNSGFSKKNQATQKKKRSEESIGGFKDPYLDLMQQRGLIELEAISFIRGRSIPNAFIIIDEAQNLSMHELKTIVTRAGEGTKIVLTGDVEQIDNVHVDTFTNGLTYAVEKFKEYDLSGHVTLLKGERSALATLASQIL